MNGCHTAFGAASDFRGKRAARRVGGQMEGGCEGPPPSAYFFPLSVPPTLSVGLLTQPIVCLVAPLPFHSIPPPQLAHVSLVSKDKGKAAEFVNLIRRKENDCRGKSIFYTRTLSKWSQVQQCDCLDAMSSVSSTSPPKRTQAVAPDHVSPSNKAS